MNAAAFVAVALAVQPGARADDLDRFYACEAAARTAGGTVTLSSQLDEAGTYRGGEGHGATDRQDPRPLVTVQWNFYAFAQTVYQSYVAIDVPLRRKVRPGQVMRLTREKTSPSAMALTGPVERSPVFVPGAHASVDLEVLLAYAGDQQQLGWVVGTGPSDRVSGTGYLDVTPVRAIAAAFPGLLAELKAKQADYRRRCTYREEPYNVDAEI
jgi:hypothetical protein